MALHVSYVVASSIGVLACGASPNGDPPASNDAPPGAGGMAFSGSGGAPSLAAGGAPSLAAGGTIPVGTGGQIGAGGVVIAEPPGGGTVYDPSVRFEWPESAPQSGTCEPGTYSGTYECELDFLGLAGQVITGQVTFELARSLNGEFLEIKDGKLAASVESGVGTGVTLRGDLIGSLDCATNAFTATVSNGTWSIVFIIPFEGPLTASLSGDLDRLTNTLSGSWSLASLQPVPGVAAPTCTGPWSVVRSPSP